MVLEEGAAISFCLAKPRRSPRAVICQRSWRAEQLFPFPLQTEMAVNEIGIDQTSILKPKAGEGIGG